MKTKIIKDNLSEGDAFKLEQERILYYVFDLNYGIDIHGYYKRNTDKYLTNQTFGGDGFSSLDHTEEWKQQHSKAMSGKNNPMYGKNLWETYSEEKDKEIREKIGKASSGENNPMYKVSPKERMDEETYKVWFNKNSERCKSQIGDNNPNAKKVTIFDENMNMLRKFNCIGDCARWLIDYYNFTSTIENIRSCIGRAIKTHKSYKGFYFETN